MRTVWQFAAVIVPVCILSSCAPQTPEEQFVRQKIPVEIQSGKLVTIEIHHLSGNGWNDIGIRCSPEVWNALTNGANNITVQLKSSNKKTTEINGVNPGSGDPYFFWDIFQTSTTYFLSVGNITRMPQWKSTF
jgi:hypothetical protein